MSVKSSTQIREEQRERVLELERERATEFGDRLLDSIRVSRSRWRGESNEDLGAETSIDNL